MGILGTRTNSLAPPYYRKMCSFAYVAECRDLLTYEQLQMVSF
jgi:hypothetical protein